MEFSSTAWKEARRLQALALRQKGWKQTEIAEALGVTDGAVSQWFRLVDRQDATALRAHSHPGRPPELTRGQKNLIPDLLSHGAEAYGFRGDVWTNARVAKVIEWEWSVCYHRSHVARLLKELQWTPQLPIVRATQRDEDAIASWRKEQWPELKKQARLERKTLVFVDESGFYLLPARVRTYAPRGETPTLRIFETHDHLSVMSAITMQGCLFTLVRDDSLTGAESVRFLKHLLVHLDRHLMVIWDGSPIHRAKEVKAYLADGATKQIHLEPLPPYAPDLNPDEGVWNHLKYVELRNVCCLDLGHLQHQLLLAVTRIRRRPYLIQSFFAGAGLDI
jgi:transposase